MVEIGLTGRCTRSQEPNDSAAQLAAAFEDLYSYSVSEEPRSFRYPARAPGLSLAGVRLVIPDHGSGLCCVRFLL